MDHEAFIAHLNNARFRAERARQAADAILLSQYGVPEETTLDPGVSVLFSQIDVKIREGLISISESLGRSYVQVYHDIQDNSRTSWAGTAHEVREIISNLLRQLAPDAEVMQQDWYKPVQNTSGPTQKQRAKYILRLRNAGSNEQEVVEQVAKLDDMIASMVRSTYSRASDAAHGHKDRHEVLRILRYFEAFAYDLLDIQDSLE